MNYRFIAGIVALLVLAAASGLAFRDTAIPASASEDVVPSQASVGNAGIPPQIECKWELPDVDSGTAGIQYGQDDDSLVDPGFPCDRENEIGARPQMADGVHNVIQVIPNAEDMPEPRRIENWVAVDHPNGVAEIDDVYWKVFHPDRTFKVQIHGTRVQLEDSGDGPTNSDAVVDLNDLGGYNDQGTMFWAAGGVTGQVTQDAIHAADWGFIDLVQQRQKDLWYAEWQIHKEQLCGEYIIEATAVANGEIDTLTNTIDIRCFYSLEIDFETVDWGTITPGGSKVLPGDTNFGSAQFPTVKNTGNSGMQVGIHFTALAQVGVPGPKEITVFDAAFGKSASQLQWIDPIDAGTEEWFSNDSIDQVLCANEVGKLDLSIHPPSVIPAGQYAGTVTVLAAWAPGICHNGIDGLAGPGRVLYGTDPREGNIMIVNTLTGEGTPLNEFPLLGPRPSLAFDPVSGLVFMGQGGGLPEIYTYHIEDDIEALLGDTGLGNASVTALEFHEDGTLFASVNIAGDGGTGADHLATIDTLDGSASVIGPFGACVDLSIPSIGEGSCDIEGIEALAFGPDGTLWGAKRARGTAGTQGLYTIDTVTGAATFQVAILDSFDEPLSGGIVSLAFDANGVLYGGTATPEGEATDGGRLVMIDTETGVFQFAGNNTATATGSSLAGLGFGS